MIRQIVVARVLLTVRLDVITDVLRSARRRHAPGDGPNEASQLTGDRGGDDIGRLAAARELAVARAQPQLRFPGDLADRPRARS